MQCRGPCANCTPPVHKDSPHALAAQARLPRSEAKERLATVEAARAVAACLTPGMPPVEHVSILPRGEYMARIIYQPQARCSSELPCEQEDLDMMSMVCSFHQPLAQLPPVLCRKLGSAVQRGGGCLPRPCLLPKKPMSLGAQHLCGALHLPGSGAVPAMRVQI